MGPQPRQRWPFFQAMAALVLISCLFLLIYLLGGREAVVLYLAMLGLLSRVLPGFLGFGPQPLPAVAREVLPPFLTRALSPIPEPAATEQTALTTGHVEEPDNQEPDGGS